MDGLLTNETKQHQVTLARTASLDNPAFNPEKGAAVSIKIRDGLSIMLDETSPGVYKTPLMAGITGTTYTLLITTSNGNNYTSEGVTLKDSPPIDNIYARYITNDTFLGAGVQIYLDTRDTKNSTHFTGGNMKARTRSKPPFPPSSSGWEEIQSLSAPWQLIIAGQRILQSPILIQSTTASPGTTFQLSPIKFIPAVSPELVIKYSILVKQYALNEKSYLFWKQLKDINESQGSLFDKQVGKVVGNVSSTNNSGETIVGYFDASGVSVKRNFFTPRQFAGYVPSPLPSELY